MTLSDAELAQAWAPRCVGKKAELQLYGRGRILIAVASIDAWRAFNRCLMAYNYPTRAADTGAFNCRLKVGGNGWSIHAYAIAGDINWITNPYGRHVVTDYPPAMRAAIKAIRTNNGRQVFTWGGDWAGNKDSMHWQLGCSPHDVATGINPATVPGGFAPPPTPPAHPTQQPPTATESEEDDEMPDYFQLTNGPTTLSNDPAADLPQGSIVRVTATTWARLTPDDWTVEQEIFGATAAMVRPVDQPKMRSIQRTRLNGNAF